MKHTLDLLSVYVGYRDYESFCNGSSVNHDVDSSPIVSDTLYSSTLKVGDKVKLMWQPNRCVICRYLGDELFEIETAANTQLEVGDRFECSAFFAGQLLYLCHLTRNNEVLGAYMCGKSNGVRFDVIRREVNRLQIR